MKKSLMFLSILLPLAVVAQTHAPVTFTSGGLTFQGTLSLPQGQGPFPVAILVHGSGPNDRDQTVHLQDPAYNCLYPGLHGKTIRNFRDIAEYLSAKGIAVLRYDKRTFTHQGTIDPKTISYFDMVSDIHAAIDHVKSCPEISSNNVVLIGHSKGVNQVALVARQRPEVSHVIGLAGTASGIDTLLANQVRYIYNTCGDPQQGELIASQIEQALSGVRNNTWNENTPIMGVYPSFWREWINVTDSTIYHFQQLAQPVLILQGEDDFNVPVGEGQKFLSGLNPSKADVYFLQGINHFLTTATSPTVAPVVLDTLYQWLLKTRVDAGTVGERRIDIQIRYTPVSIIILSENKKIQEAGIYSLNGSMVKSFNPLANELVIHKKDFQQGVYLLRVNTASGSGIRRIVF